jgi:hypothetical protein
MPRGIQSDSNKNKLRGPSSVAEGVGLLPAIGKTLKINGRFRRYVVQGYRTGVPLGNGHFSVRPAGKRCWNVEKR